jgi:hypothetical protein
MRIRIGKSALLFIIAVISVVPAAAQLAPALPTRPSAELAFPFWWPRCASFVQLSAISLACRSLGNDWRDQ